MIPSRMPGWARFALPILLFISCTSLSRALSCVLPVPSSKGRLISESFQHVTPSPSAFFALHWNSTGDSALSADAVPLILAALDSARSHFSHLPGMWSIPLGPRSAYPVLALPQATPGATTLPFELDGVSGLTWIQLDTDFSRWGGEPDVLLEVTCAHEVFHAIQFAQGGDLRDLAFYEASAVWAEDQCFPTHDDWAWRYLPHLLEQLAAPWDHTDGQREYGAGAMVKHLLHSSWEPCRVALTQADASHRCWPLFLGQLEDPPADMARLLAELLLAGDSTARAWWVPELAEAPPVQRDLALDRHGGIPPEAAELPGLSWIALPVEATGALRPCATIPLFMIDAGLCSSLPCDSMVEARQGAWMALVNVEEGVAQGLTGLWWEPAVALKIWPNPGGVHRQVLFQDAPGSLEICNLLGQRLAFWRPPGEGRGPFHLELPPATGTLLVRQWPTGASATLTLLH